MGVKKPSKKRKRQSRVNGLVRLDFKIYVHPRIKKEIQEKSRKSGWSTSGMIANLVINDLGLIPEEARHAAISRGNSRDRRRRR
jgi:hypothetical protein